MSHFTVLVIGKNPEQQLQPFHQFECTGTDDQYVLDIDQTDKIKKTFESDMVGRLKDTNGLLHEPYDDKFYRDPLLGENPGMGTGCGDGVSWTSKDWGDGKGYRPKVHFIPERFEEVEVSRMSVESFKEYVEDYEGKAIIPFGETPDLDGKHKYGYALVDENDNITKIIHRTNPNRQWDWYELGGRWTGFFKLKTKIYVNEFNETVIEDDTATVGSPGFMTKRAENGYADQCLKSQIDFEFMEADASLKASNEYEKAMSIVGHLPVNETWLYTLNLYPDIKKAREKYGCQPRCKAWNQSKIAQKEFGFYTSADDFLISKEEYIQNAINSSCSPFALVKNYKWQQKGQMGWFGMSTEEMTQNEWNAKVHEIIAALPDDTMLSLYDCHI